MPGGWLPWFPLERGEQTCLRIAEAAERDTELNNESQGALPSDPAAKLLQPQLAQRNTAQREALLNAGVDAGRKTVPVNGEVSLDIPLHEKKYERPSRGFVG